MTLSSQQMILVALLLGVSSSLGCSGGKSATAIATPPLIESLNLIVDPETAIVDFSVTDPEENEWVATIHYSEDLGQNWAHVSSQSLLDPEIQIAPPFLPIKRNWDYRDDLSTIPQADILIEVRIADLEGKVVTSRQTAPIAIGESEAPVFAGVYFPETSIGGLVTIQGSVIDPDYDHVTISMEWSPTGGAPWQAATLQQDQIILPPQSDGRSTDFEIYWDAQADAPEVISPFAKVKIHASDGGATTTYVSNYLALNTIRPGIDLITIGEIPEYMNGQESYQGGGTTLVPFKLSVPSAGTQLNLEWSSGSGGATVDSESLEVFADVSVLGHAPGENLAEYFSTTSSGATWNMPQQQVLPIGSVTLSASVKDQRGNLSDLVEYEIEVRSGSSANRPFSAEDRWFIDFSRDHFQIGLLDDGSGNLTPFANSGADGIPDHLQDLFTVGLQSQMDPTASTVMDSYVRSMIESQVIERIHLLYEKTGTSDLQPQLSFHGHGSGATSALGIGGDDVEPLSYALGRAVFDTRNRFFDDEREPGRGVFSSNMVQYYWNSYTFNQRFSALMPGIGSPIGTHSQDPLVLSPDFERTDTGNPPQANARFDEVWNAIEAWSRLISVVAAHEIGHAIGLCTNGHPPLGLFGGVSSANFTGPFTTPYHVDTPGNNVMSSALGLSSALVEGPSGYRFNELNQAYIAEWIVLEQ
ncbi:MAG: hypothetical protein CBC13_07215 [Planctomycetia bacterium TMED53]|nr:MAG: hypothetical protein CBC13_07215 [Planctomycetia bacterium TMED53]